MSNFHFVFLDKQQKSVNAFFFRITKSLSNYCAELICYRLDFEKIHTLVFLRIEFTIILPFERIFLFLDLRNNWESFFNIVLPGVTSDTTVGVKGESWSSFTISTY